MTVGANLDAAISGLNARVESARKAAGELARMSDKVVSESENNKKAEPTADGKGSFIDVTA